MLVITLAGIVMFSLFESNFLVLDDSDLSSSSRNRTNHSHYHSHMTEIPNENDTNLMNLPKINNQLNETTPSAGNKTQENESVSVKYPNRVFEEWKHEFPCYPNKGVGRDKNLKGLVYVKIPKPHVLCLYTELCVAL